MHTELHTWILLGPLLLLISIPLSSFLYGKFFVHNDYVLNRWLHRLFSLFFAITPLVLIVIRVFVVAEYNFDQDDNLIGGIIRGYPLYKFFTIPDPHALGLKWLLFQILLLSLVHSLISLLFLFRRVSNSLMLASVTSQVSVLTYIVMVIGMIVGVQTTKIEAGAITLATAEFSMIGPLAFVTLVGFYALFTVFVWEWTMRKRRPGLSGEEKFLFPADDETS